MSSASKKKIIVAMSGGVDSSVAAGILAQEGHEVIGITLRLLPKGGSGFGCCGSPDDLLIAKRSAEKAGVPHYVLDYSPEFEKNVINYFVDSYISGETPNPCLACNRYIKFDKLKAFAQTLDATHLATGHYARIVTDEVDGNFRNRLFEACDPSKDQSYVLYTIGQKSLESTLFPVGNKPKSEIREIARKMGLPNADKKDSQEICFVPNRDYRSFVNQKIQDRGLDNTPTTTPGVIKDTSGKTVGEHNGVAFYTIGQRKGLDVKSNIPIYVTDIDAKSNTIIVGDDSANLCTGLEANDLHMISNRHNDKEFRALVKIRYKHEPTSATIKIENNKFTATFDEPQRAVSPGQAAVIYQWDPQVNAREVIGGGKIIKALK